MIARRRAPPLARSSRLAALLVAFVAACTERGSPAGAPCTRPSTCESRLCLSRPGGAVCARACVRTGECSAGEICGRFDFRGVDPDAGERVGPPNEILQVCRAPLNTACDAAQPCTAPGRLCASGREGAAGMCALPCAQSTDCLSRLCVPSSDTCGAPLSCAVLCDDTSECAAGFFCNTAASDSIGHGRCERITGGDDVETPCDASTDASSDAP